MATITHISRRRLSTLLLCVVIGLSLMAPLVSIAAAGANTMPCCAGKAGHCDSGIAPKQVLPPTSEPMCGLKEAATEDDGITIVAEPSTHSHNHSAEHSSSSPAAESPSLGQPCRMDCGACLAGLNRQQKRERGVVHTFALGSLSPVTSDRAEYLSSAFSSNTDWNSTSPRGPPATLL